MRGSYIILYTIAENTEIVQESRHLFEKFSPVCAEYKLEETHPHKKTD